MNMMAQGELALTDFQRSQVWGDSLSARFLKAVILGRPTGTVLLVKSGNKLGRRQIKGNDANVENAQSLILDGQQRLTSLWQALMDTSKRKFYLKVESLRDVNLHVSDLIHRAKDFQGYLSKEDQLSNNVIPLSILYDPPDHDANSPTRLEKWCEGVIPGNAHGSGHLRRAIARNLQKPLQQYKIWFAEFGNISTDEAATIFVEANSSSVKVKAFDLAVARALQLHNPIKLRERVQDFHDKHDRVQHYFKGDEQKWIPNIGEWILKIACLKYHVGEGLSPKDIHFEKALESIFSSGTQDADRVESNLNAALQFIENRGVPTADILPRIPPVYVIAALQDELEQIRATNRSKAVKLLSTYLWRSFFSDRYEKQANDRLYEDYQKLRKDLRRIKQNGDAKGDAPTIRSAQIIEESALCDQDNPFGSKSPIGRAILALALHNHSLDWVTGEELTVSEVRLLGQNNQLNRHHVFPRQTLRDGGLEDRNLKNHGLNVVLLRQDANITLGGKGPVHYLDKLKRKNTQLTHEELKRRVESHLLSYEKLVSDTGTVANRYKNYLMARARVLWKKIDAYTRWP